MQPVRFSTREVQRLAQRAVVGPALGRRGERRLARALEGSEQDRRAYDQLVGLVCALEGSDSLTSAQHDRILHRARLEAGVQALKKEPTLLRRLAPALAAAVVIVVVALIALFAPDTDHRDQLQPRGQGTVTARQGLVGLKAFCVRRGDIVPPPRADGIEADCQLADELQLSLTHTAGHTNLLVVGRHEDGGELWYFPAPPTGRSAPAPQEVRDEPLGQAVRLSVNHRPGVVRLVAVFSNKPVEASPLFGWLEALDADAPAEPLVRRHLKQHEVTVVELRVKIEGGAP